MCSWHSRYIPQSSTSPSGGLRTNVTFLREDLLWKSTEPVTDPYTGEEYHFPFGERDSSNSVVLTGANILDMLERVRLEIPDTEPPQHKIYWRIRDPQSLFSKLKHREEQGTIWKKYTAGGTKIDQEDDFIRVEKKSSVSINAIVFKLATGMTGNYAIASRQIGELAADAWSRDLIRAKLLYDTIKTAGGQIEEANILRQCRTKSTISQEVETAILKECCHWLGVDPDQKISRPRGQPRKHRYKEEKNLVSGEVIELELLDDGSVRGRLICDFDGLRANTPLETLTLIRLAELLVHLREKELEEDAELLSAYLDAVDEEWQEKVAAEAQGTTVEVEDPWTILGVDRSASPQDIKRTYRNIMKSIHPDTSGLPNWISAKVNQAYEQLQNQ